MARKRAARVLRHDLTVRLLHGANAAVLLVLVLTGLALGDQLTVWIVGTLGGHAAINATHRVLGLVFIITGALAIGILHGRACALARDLTQFRRRDLAWPVVLLRQTLINAEHPQAFHSGRFNPAERIVLLILLLSTIVAGASGLYLYFLPSAPRWVTMLAMRAHIYGAWTMIVIGTLHMSVGLGLLPTHRGIARTMFGDGSLPVATARRLWPEWTRKHLGEADPAHELH